jgi:hypothetical protein
MQPMEEVFEIACSKCAARSERSKSEVASARVPSLLEPKSDRIDYWQDHPAGNPCSAYHASYLANLKANSTERASAQSGLEGLRRLGKLAKKSTHLRSRSKPQNFCHVPWYLGAPLGCAGASAGVIGLCWRICGATVQRRGTESLGFEKKRENLGHLCPIQQEIKSVLLLEIKRR